MLEDYSLLVVSKGCIKFFTQSSSLFLFLVVGTIYLHYFFSNSPNVCKTNNVGDFHSLPRQTAYYLYSKEVFLVFNFQTN